MSLGGPPRPTAKCLHVCEEFRQVPRDARQGLDGPLAGAQFDCPDEHHEQPLAGALRRMPLHDGREEAR
jgi:hypothetical protein